jgi:ATP-dependent Clp protease ATP-binding subunit ClpA
MYERFTDRARKVMQLANQEAMHYQHEYIGTEHILLALAKEGTGVAACVLKFLDVDLHKIRREVEKIVQANSDYDAMGKLLNTPRAKKVIEYAIEEAKSLGHNYVGTEHLLLGLLRDDETVAAQVLLKLGLELKIVRADVLNILGHFPDPCDKDEEDVVVEEAPRLEIQHLPECAREIVAEFDCQIDVIKEEKQQAVGVQAFELAGKLYDLERKLMKLRDEFISQWPKS